VGTTKDTKNTKGEKTRKQCHSVMSHWIGRIYGGSHFVSFVYFVVYSQ